jgi:hypothetical protein
MQFYLPLQNQISIGLVEITNSKMAHLTKHCAQEIFDQARRKNKNDTFISDAREWILIFFILRSSPFPFSFEK